MLLCLRWAEFILALLAAWAFPICGQILKVSSCRNAMFRVANGRVVDLTADFRSFSVMHAGFTYSPEKSVSMITESS